MLDCRKKKKKWSCWRPHSKCVAHSRGWGWVVRECVFSITNPIACFLSAPKDWPMKERNLRHLQNCDEYRRHSRHPFISARQDAIFACLPSLNSKEEPYAFWNVEQCPLKVLKIRRHRRCFETGVFSFFQSLRFLQANGVSRKVIVHIYIFFLQRTYDKHWSGEKKGDLVRNSSKWPRSLEALQQKHITILVKARTLWFLHCWASLWSSTVEPR